MQINVLMCGGRRAGKTSIMAAIRENVSTRFPSGDVVLRMEKAGELIKVLQANQAKFSMQYDDEEIIVADDHPSRESSDYLCDVFLEKKNVNMNLNFTDVPGEWFYKPEYNADIIKRISQSHVLIIAIDTPHMMEQPDKDGIGRYHDVFNRPAFITERIKEAFQGNKEPRLVLFVPVKCEFYRPSPDHPKNRMSDVALTVQKAYEPLLDWLKQNGLYTVAIAPCFTFGGLEYLRFTPPLDAHGAPVKKPDGSETPDVEKDPSTGLLNMNYITQYQMLRDQNDRHYYKPQYCEQPLLYILIYLIAMCPKKRHTIMGPLWRLLGIWPNKKSLLNCKNAIANQLNRNGEEGFVLLKDTIGIE